MTAKFPHLLLTLSLTSAAGVAAAADARAQQQPAAVTAAAARAETDRDRDGLQGPVRRVRVETSKLVTRDGKPAEGARALMETATYDMKGAKIDNAYFLGASGALTGREVYKYDDRGNIVEMTLFNADGSVLSKEKYDYEFDAMGNWMRMTTSVAVIENGKLSFEPAEVTYRSIAYYLEDAATKKLQSGQLAGAPPAAAPNANAAASSPAANAGQSAALRPQAGAAKPQPPAPQKSAPAAAPGSALLKSAAPGVALLAPDRMPAGAVTGGGAAPAVRVSGDDAPPPPKPPTRPISGGALNGKAVSLPSPVYPETARRARLVGTVTVEVVIDVSGRVISARAVTGHAMLREAAERAAMQARFTPTLLSGHPVKISGTIDYNFKL